MSNQNLTTVVLADDHELLRDGLKALFKKLKNIKLLYEATNGKDLLDAVIKYKPQVVITDIKMPVMDGIEVTKQIRQQFPGIKIIALSNYDEEKLIADMITAGADGYLIKNASKNEFTDAIKTVLAGKVYYCKVTSTAILNHLSDNKISATKKEKEIQFTKREMEVLKLMCKGMTNKEIGGHLKISSRTVESHRHSIMDKTGYKSPVTLALFASRLGYI